MKKKWLSILLAGIMLLSMAPIAFALPEDQPEDPFLQYLQDEYQTPEKKYWPEVRWWMNMGYHTDETLTEALDDLSNSGFSAVEFLAMGNATNPNNARYGWGSDEWVEDSKLLIKEATKRGMGFSLTSGAHWGNANLPITWEIEPGVSWSQDHPAAGQTLSQTNVNVAAGTTYTGTLPRSVGNRTAATKTTLAAVVAVGYNGTGGNADLDYNDTHVIDWDDTDLTSTGVNITWEAPTAHANYRIFAYWIHGSAVTANPSSSTNYMINYVDPEGIQAVQKYWEEKILTPDMRELIRDNGRGEIYMDSLELGSRGNTGLIWGFTLLDEFYNLHGYRLEPYLPFIMGGSISMNTATFAYFPNNATTGRSGQPFIDKVRNDFYQVMTETYIKNVLDPMTAWLHDFGMTLRCEPAYSSGAFYCLSQSAKHVDTLETESLEFGTQIDSFRNFAGPARLYGKTFSSETGALNTSQRYAYADSLERYSQIVNIQMASGVSRVSMHSTTVRWSDSATTAWPGFISSSGSFGERWDNRHPFSEQYREWTAQIARNQKAMRQGIPRSDVGILRADNVMNMMIFELREGTNGMHADSTAFMYWKDLSMQEAGYNYDYFAPMLLQDDDIVFADGVVQPDGPGYQALLVYQEEMPLESAKVLLDWAKNGLPVVIANGATEMESSAARTRTHSAAAIRTYFSTESDTELAAIMDEMKALDNVAVINNQSDVVPALKSLGVRPRAEYVVPNNKILTCMREDVDNNALYLYAYNYKPGYHETKTWSNLGTPTTFEVSIDAIGKPYAINAWTGEVESIGTYRIENDRTIVEITLDPAETTLIALNLGDESLHAVQSDAYKSAALNGNFYLTAVESGTYTTVLSDGRTIETDIQVPANITLGPWDLTVTTWTAGELETRTETKPGRSPTTEYAFKTEKTPVNLGTFDWQDLKPWRELGVNKSGVGTYSTTFTLPANWAENNGAILQFESVYRGAVVAIINDIRVAVPFESLKVDITKYLQPGLNTIRVVIGSSLGMSVGGTGTTNLNYGMVGETKLITYTTEPILTTVGIRSDEKASIGSKIDYTFKADEMQTVNLIDLTFVVDGDMLAGTDESITAMSGFAVFEGIKWTNLGNGKWQGHVILATYTGVTKSGSMEVAKLGLDAKKLGDATVTLTAVTVYGIDIIDGKATSNPRQTLISPATATTAVYSIYDLNGDGKVDYADLALAFYYLHSKAGGTDWDDAKVADVTGEGEVTMADLMEIYVNFV